MIAAKDSGELLKKVIPEIKDLFLLEKVAPIRDEVEIAPVISAFP